MVIRAAGIFGVGGHLVAVPIDKFSWMADAAAFRFDKTGYDLKSMVEWRAPGTAAAATESGLPPEKKKRGQPYLTVVSLKYEQPHFATSGHAMPIWCSR